MAKRGLREIVAEWLERGLQHSGLSQGQAADRAKVARSTLSRIANQKVDADPDTIKRLERVMGYPFPEIEGVFQVPDDDSTGRQQGAATRPRSGQRKVAEGRALYSSVEEFEAAYLRFVLQMTRELSAAEREGASPQVLLRLVDLAEKVAVPVHGKRAKHFLDDERERIRRGETLDVGSDR